jgi:tetratricopeptide (TPR) repeat protein
MKLNSFLIILLSFFASQLVAVDANLLFKQANDFYAKNEFNKAIELYEKIETSEMVSFELYYNLGNAYYKNNEIGKAILNYERAKKINPEDEDINFNLKLANQKTEDKIEAAPKLFLSEWKTGIIDTMSEKAWSFTAIILFLFGLVLLFLFFYFQQRLLKKIGFFLGLIMLALSVFAFVFAKSSHELAAYSNEAVVTAPSVTVLGSPNEKGTKLFVLHEGVKVTITGSETSDWIEIKIANGNVGWIHLNKLEKI